MSLVAYRWFSTPDRPEFFEPQRAALVHAGWAGKLVIGEWYEDVCPAGTAIERRSGLQAALAGVASGTAAGIAVARLDTLGPSTADILAVVVRAMRESWRLVALDVYLDTSTPTGELVCATLAAAVRIGRRQISERQLEKHLVLRQAGRPRGRQAVSPEVGDDVLALRESGSTWQAIADSLNEAGVPTVRGGAQWRPSSARSVWVTRTRELATRTSTTAL
jgi:DNA invertase Pin-like site-specific DNA recombinase